MSGSEAATGGNRSLYYRGTIQRLRRGTEAGVVRSQSGRETVFVFRHVEMRGELRRFSDLREGMEVGFDVGWTSSGLRVTVIHAPLASDSERQTGAEEQVATEDFADRDAEDGDIE